jgi:L-fucose/D-arabinose isomerase
MRTTAIGLVMMNDERPHVHHQNEAETTAVLHGWANALRPRLRNRDGTSPEIVVGAETIKNVRSAQVVGEALRRAGCRWLVLCLGLAREDWSGRR